MIDDVKTFDVKGCSPYCYGGYRMEEDSDGYGDYVLAEDYKKLKDKYEAILEMHSMS